MNMSVEQELDALTDILFALQEAVAHQTRSDLKEHGNRNLIVAIQNTKRLILNTRENLLASEIDEHLDLCSSLGLNNIS